MINLQLKIGRILYTFSSMLNCQYLQPGAENTFSFSRRLVFMAGTTGEVEVEVVVEMKNR